MTLEIVEAFLDGSDGEGDEERKERGERADRSDDGDELETRNQQEVQVERSSELFEQVQGNECEGCITRVTNCVVAILIWRECFDDTILKFFIFFSFW